MSIFPKRTVRNSTVTIHWNFNTAHLTDRHIFPYVRIGVVAPDGSITMLLEQHMLSLPGIRIQRPSPPPVKPLYLNKNTPLLVLADYLAGQHRKEKLVEILENIQNGIHHYLTYTVPADASPGRYRLISEIYSNGKTKYSTTAADDFFLVEEVTVVQEGTAVTLQNMSPEATPVKLITYFPGSMVEEEDITAFELPPYGSFRVEDTTGKYLSYNEERIMIPLQQQGSKRCARNQRLLPLEKDDALHLMNETDTAYTLTGPARSIWEQADGIITRTDIRISPHEALYDELLAHQIIIEH